MTKGSEGGMQLTHGKEGIEKMGGGNREERQIYEDENGFREVRKEKMASGERKEKRFKKKHSDLGTTVE